MASLIVKKLDKIIEDTENHNMLDDYVTVADNLKSEIVELKERNGKLQRELDRVVDLMKGNPSKNERKLKEKFAEQERDRMIKQLCAELEAEKKEHENYKDAYNVEIQKMKMEKDYIKNSSGVDSMMAKTRNDYLMNLRDITGHYSGAICVIAKEIKKIKWSSNRIIKQPDIAKNIVTDIIDGAKKLEVLVPHFEKFIERFNGGDDIRAALRGYFQRKDNLMKAINKTIFLQEFSQYKKKNADPRSLPRQAENQDTSIFKDRPLTGMHRSSDFRGGKAVGSKGEQTTFTLTKKEDAGRNRLQGIGQGSTSMKGQFAPVLGIAGQQSGANRDLAKSRSENKGMVGFGSHQDLAEGKIPAREGNFFKKGNNN